MDGTMWPSILVSIVIASTPAQLGGQEAPLTWTPEQQAVIEAASVGPVGIEDDFDRWEDGFLPAWSYWRVGTEETRARATHMGLVRDVVAAGNRIERFELVPVDVIVRGDVALLRYNAVETLRQPDGETRVIRYSSADLYAKEQGVWRTLATNIVYLPDDG